MTIFIVGLGLMGASYAEKLTSLNYVVYGYDHNQVVLNKAIESNIILKSTLEDLKQADLVILTLYPNDVSEFVRKYAKKLKPGSLLTDITGIKSMVVKEVESVLPSTIHYMSHHPMAGRAKKGFNAKDPAMFLGNHFILVTTPRSTEEDARVLTKIADDLGFSHIVTTDPEMHDRHIAYTSQLTHAIAVSLMHGYDQLDQYTTGDSFRDLTRIANINELLWSELMMGNQSYLIEQINHFEAALDRLKETLMSKDIEGLKQYLKEGREKRLKFENKS
jgi:prephenate dehydrogenase